MISFTMSCWEHYLHVSFLCLCSFYLLNDHIPKQTQNFDKICDLFCLPLVSKRPVLDPGSLFTQGKLQKLKTTVNHKYAITFLCELCLSSTPCSQTVLGRLSYCELPWLIVKHVLVNQAYPKWQRLSRHYNELPKPL